MTKLRARRITSGKTLTAFAKELRDQSSNLSAVERGRMAASARMAAALAQYYGVDASELFGGNGLAV